ncbi:MAG TPA: prepilin peptidase [Candidatus Dormibacteraeota bacterium]
MNGVAVAVAAVAGAAAGLAAGTASVWLERTERLEEEELEERRAYEDDCVQKAEEAAAEGREPPVVLPWKSERYGWTWLERWMAPVLGAVGYAAFTAHDPAGAGLFIHLLWVTVFVHVVVFDVKHRLILNRITYPATIAALALSPFSPGLTFPHALAGAVAVYVVFVVQSLLLGGSVLGMGDAKLGAVVGATTGLGLDTQHLGAVYAVIAAVLIGGVAAALLLVTRIRGLKDPIPYGPFLCAGAALIMYVGPAGP